MLAVDMTLIWSRSFLVYHVIIFEFTELFDFLKWWSEIQSFKSYLKRNICVKSVQIRGFFWSVFSRIRTEYGSEKTPYLNTFHSARIRLYTCDHGIFTVWCIYDALVSFAVLAIIFYMYLLKLDLNLPIYLCAWSYLLLLLLLLSLLFVTLTLIRHIDWYELELEKCILLIWFFFSTILSTRNKAFQSNLIEW